MFIHLPSELKVVAGALSRLYALEEVRKSFAKELEGVHESYLPELAPKFWKGWLEKSPP